jgi:hypothetical protein
MTIDRILSIFATIVSVVAVPASGYLSYHYAIKGEKRKEFNAVTDNLRFKFREQLRLLDENIYPAGGKLEIAEAEIESLIDVSKKSESNKIIFAWNLYKDSLKSSGSFNEYNDYKMHDPDSVKRSISDLMTYLKRQ